MTAINRNLRYGSREQRVVVKHAGISRYAVDVFLHARPSGIVDKNERAAGAQRKLHHLRDFVAVHFAGRAACNREVLARQMHQPSIDRGAACHYTVGGQIFLRHAEIRGVMLRKKADLLKALAVHQFCNTLPRRQLAAGVMLFDSLFAATKFNLLARVA